MALQGNTARARALIALLALSVLLAVAGCGRSASHRGGLPATVAVETAPGVVVTSVPARPEPTMIADALTLSSMEPGEVRVVGAGLPPVRASLDAEGARRALGWGGFVRDVTVGPDGTFYLQTLVRQPDPDTRYGSSRNWEWSVAVLSPQGELLYRANTTVRDEGGAALVAGPDGEYYMTIGDYTHAVGPDRRTVLIYPCRKAETGQYLACAGDVLATASGDLVTAWPVARACGPSASRLIRADRIPWFTVDGRGMRGGPPVSHACAAESDALWAARLPEGGAARGLWLTADGRTAYVLAEAGGRLALIALAGGEEKGRAKLSGSEAWVSVAGDGTACFADSSSVGSLHPLAGRVATRAFEGASAAPVSTAEGFAVVPRSGGLTGLRTGAGASWEAEFPFDVDRPHALALGPDGTIYAAGSRLAAAFDSHGGLLWVCPLPTATRTRGQADVASAAFVRVRDDGAVVLVTTDGAYVCLGGPNPKAAKAPSRLAPTPVEDPWPQMGRDPGRTGLSPVRGPRNPSLASAGSLGDFGLKGALTSSLRIGAGPVLGRDGAVYGALFPNDAGLFGMPSGGSPWTVVVGAHGTWWPCLRPDGRLWLAGEAKTTLIDPSGAILAETPHDASRAAPVMASNGDLYTLTHRHGEECQTLVRIDGKGNLSEVGRFGLNMASKWGPALGPDGTLYVGGVLPPDADAPPGERARLWAVTPQGRILWEAPLNTCSCPEWIAVEPDGTVAVTSGYGFHRFSPDGALLPAADRVGTTQALAGPAAIGPDGTCYIQAHGLTAVAPDGTIRWTIDFGDRSGSYSPPVVDVEGVVYVVSQGTVRAIRPDGATLWVARLARWGSGTGDGVHWPALDSAGRLHVVGPGDETWVLADE